MKRKHLLLISILLSIIFLMTGCDSISTDFSGNSSKDSIQASGVIEADQVSIASELSGRIKEVFVQEGENVKICLLYTSPSPRDRQKSRMPSSA